MSTLSSRQTLVERSAGHLRQGTTDQGESTMELAVSDYLDTAIWQREIEALFRRRPLLLGMAGDLPEPGTYRALTITGIPVLLVRAKDGQARAFLNVCSHRGTQLVPDGAGKAGRFSCSYHAWTFDALGQLIGVYDEAMFGPVDRAQRGLKALPCAERAGFIWGVLTPGVPFDIDAWLGDYAQVLADLDVGAWHVAERRTLPGPNWKVAFDGYMEGYHFNVLHRPSVAVDTKGTMLHDQFGPHQRLIFAREALRQLGEAEQAAKAPAELIFPVHTIYPNTSIAGGYEDQILVSQVLPGPTIDSSITLMTTLSRRPLADDTRQQDRMKKYTEYIYKVIRDEDYAAGQRIQAGLASGANRTFLLGRNEYPLQHFHTWLTRHRNEPLPQAAA